MWIVVPVIYAAESLAKKATVAATSSTLPNRFVDPPERSSDAVKLVFPVPPWPTTAMFAI